MKRTLLRALSALMTCLILSGCCSWEWEADIYEFDFENQELVNAHGHRVSFSDPRIEEFSALHESNIIELAIEIEKQKKCNRQK